MEIISKSGRVYSVIAKEAGWSYARPSVRVKRKRFFFFDYYHEVWRSDPYPRPVLLEDARTATKEWMTQWFRDSVEQYEAYERNWGRMPAHENLEVIKDE